MSLGKWKLSSDTEWRDSGSVDLVEGTYYVQFEDIDGYIPPAQEIVELTEDKTVVGVYYQHFYELVVTSNLDEWEWVHWKLSSDSTEYTTLTPVSLQPGQYTIEFIPIAGYTTPNPVTIILTRDMVVTGNFMITLYTKIKLVDNAVLTSLEED